MLALLAGRDSRVTIGTVPVEICVDSFSIKGTRDIIKERGTCTRGHTRNYGGFRSYNVSFKGHFDRTKNPMAPANFGIRAGATLTDVKFELKIGDALRTFLAGTAKVASATVSDNAPGRCDIDVTLEVNKKLQYPTV
jgi:hypothetical protein